LNLLIAFKSVLQVLSLGTPSIIPSAYSLVYSMLLSNIFMCISDVYARVYSCRQCWASKCRGL
jgi:hypothetical protein